MILHIVISLLVGASASGPVKTAVHLYDIFSGSGGINLGCHQGYFFFKSLTEALVTQGRSLKEADIYHARRA